jgi:hypothetical protein
MVRGTEPLREDETCGAAAMGNTLSVEFAAVGCSEDEPTCRDSPTGSSIAASCSLLLLVHSLSHQLVQVPILIPSIICVDISLGTRVGVDTDPQLEVVAEMLLAGYMGE